MDFIFLQKQEFCQLLHCKKKILGLCCKVEDKLSFAYLSPCPHLFHYFPFLSRTSSQKSKGGRKLSKERQRPCWNVTAHILGTQQEQINSESMMVSTTKHTSSLGASKLHSFTDVMFFLTAVSRITKRGCVDWSYWTRSLGSAIL